MSNPSVSLKIKLVYTAFMAVFVPCYWIHYGPTNFLWFCDVALFMTLVALWWESRLLWSMAAVSILIPQAIWIVEFAAVPILGHGFLGVANYMYSDQTPLYMRGLSLFHIWFPCLLLWLVCKFGYDRRAFRLQTVLCLIVLLLSLAAQAETGPSVPVGNLNKVWGPGAYVVQSMPLAAWLPIVLALYVLGIFLPTHLVLRCLRGGAQAAAAPVHPIPSACA